MLDVLTVLTTALELAAVLMLLVAIGWATWLWVGSPFAGPAALASTGIAALCASRALLWLADRGRDR